jgi:hypothetical protein
MWVWVGGEGGVMSGASWGCGDQPNKRIFLARRMLFPKTVSPHKQTLAQIKVAVDSICTPPSVIPHNLSIIFQPNFAHKIQKKLF